MGILFCLWAASRRVIRGSAFGLLSIFPQGMEIPLPADTARTVQDLNLSHDFPLSRGKKEGPR